MAARVKFCRLTRLTGPTLPGSPPDLVFVNPTQVTKVLPLGGINALVYVADGDEPLRVKESAATTVAALEKAMTPAWRGWFRSRR